MAGGTVYLHVSGRRQFNLKGGCATLFHFFGMEKPEFCFCMSYFKPNPNQTKRNPHLMSDTVMWNTVFFCFRESLANAKHLLMKHCSDVKHSSLDVNLCMSVEFVLSFACLWTHLDRVGLQFLMFLQCFG